MLCILPQFLKKIWAQPNREWRCGKKDLLFLEEGVVEKVDYVELGAPLVLWVQHLHVLTLYVNTWARIWLRSGSILVNNLDSKLFT